MSRVKAKRPAKKTAHAHALRNRIEAERRKLRKATSVLLATVIALDYGLERELAGDAAAVALDLVEQAIDALDSVALTASKSP